MKKKTSDWTSLLSNELGIQSVDTEIPKGAKSIAELAKEWGVAENTAYRHTKALLDKGLIEKFVVKNGQYKKAYFTIKK